MSGLCDLYDMELNLDPIEFELQALRLTSGYLELFGKKGKYKKISLQELSLIKWKNDDKQNVIKCRITGTYIQGPAIFTNGHKGATYSVIITGKKEQIKIFKKTQLK